MVLNKGANSDGLRQMIETARIENNKKIIPLGSGLVSNFWTLLTIRNSNLKPSIFIETNYFINNSRILKLSKIICLIHKHHIFVIGIDILRIFWNNISNSARYRSFDTIYLHRKISNQDRKCYFTGKGSKGTVKLLMIKMGFFHSWMQI